MTIGGAVLVAPTPGDIARYFSPDSFLQGARCPGQPGDGMPAVDDFTAEWYAKIWRAAEEPSLYLQAREAKPPFRRTYRFTLVPTFHAPIVVRLDEGKDGRLRMVAKRLSGQGGYDPGQVAERIERTLTPEETRAILRVLDETQVMTADPILCAAGLDGTQWIVEGVEGGRLHYADRWSPEDGPVRDTGMAFLALTGWAWKS